MDTVIIHEAKTRLSRLVEEVTAGVEIVIAQNGVLKGMIRYPHDFDAPLTGEVLALFEGRRRN